MDNLEQYRFRQLERQRRSDAPRMRAEFWARKAEQANNVVPIRKGI